MNKAPIAVSVYNRPLHFRNCIESLRQNLGAEDTILYISSDGPKDDRSRILVEQVRSYIKTIYGFKKIIAFTPNENTKKQVWYDTRQKLSDDNDRFIITEDDNVFSKFFLKFVNDGLNKYKYNDRVSAICGYNYPNFPMTRLESVALQHFTAWGYGTWRDRDVLSRFNMSALASDIFANKELFGSINRSIPHIAPMLRDMLDGRLIAGDVFVCSKLFMDNRICIFPSKSLVRNLGNDGSGEHCGVKNIYSEQSISNEEITLEKLQSLTPLKINRIWLYKYDGGQLEEFKSWLIFWEINKKYKYIRKLIKSSVGFFRLVQRFLVIAIKTVTGKLS